jgi:competence protein ComEC
MTILRQQQYFGYLLLAGNLLFWFGYGHPVLSGFLISLVLILLKHANFNLLCCAFCTGFVTALLTYITLDGWQFDETLSQHNHRIRAQIKEPVARDHFPRQYSLEVYELNNRALPAIRMRIQCFQLCPPIQEGETWQLLVRLRPPTSRYNPESFDYERWLFSHDIRAQGYLVASQYNRLITPADDLSRGTIKDHLRLLFPAQQSFATASSLLLGDRSELSQQQRQLLANAGLTHLIAISGMHIGLAFLPGYLGGWLIWLVLSKTALRRQTVQWLTGLLFAFSYAVIAGFAVPAQRAFIMLLAFGMATLSNRNMNLWSRLGLATTVIILLEPRASLGSSFWLSYSITVLIVIFIEVQRHRPWLSLVQLQLALAWLMPVIQWFIFGQYSLITIAQNLWAIPLLSFILMPLSMLLLLGILLRPEQLLPGMTWLADCLDMIFTGFWHILGVIQPLTDASILYGSVSVIQAGLLLLLAFIIWLPITMKLRFGLLVLMSALQLSAQDTQSLFLRMFDVGQGLAVAIHQADETMLYDTAYAYDQHVILAGIWPAWSRQHKISVLNHVILSHADIDHSGGFSWLAETQPLQQVLSYPGNAQQQPVCTAGKTFDIGKASATVLLPLDVTVKDDNNGSCVILLNYAGRSILLTGDIELYAEQQLVSQYPLLKVDILLVPHHGSRTSSGLALLEQLAPTTALNSSGYLNRFGLPHTEVINRYKKLGIHFIDTATAGAIDLMINEKGDIKISTGRQQNPALWRRN